MVVNGLMTKFEEIESKTLKAIGYQQNQPLKTYYLVFAVIKSLGYSINFLQFADIVYQQTNFILKRKTAGEIKKMYQLHTTNSPSLKCKDQEVLPVKVEEEEIQVQC